MSVAAGIILTGVVPIGLQISNGDAAKFPQAVIRDQDDAIITTINLAHVANGFYRPAANFLMPNNAFVSVQYLIFTDAGHTTQATSLGIDVDVFPLAVQTPSSSSAGSAVKGKIKMTTILIGKLPQTQQIKGVIKKTDIIKGTLKGGKLIGRAKKVDNIKGKLIKTSNLKGLL